MYCVCYDNGREFENTYFKKEENAKKCLLWYAFNGSNLKLEDVEEDTKIYLDEYEETRVKYYKIKIED